MSPYVKRDDAKVPPWEVWRGLVRGKDGDATMRVILLCSGDEVCANVEVLDHDSLGGERWDPCSSSCFADYWEPAITAALHQTNLINAPKGWPRRELKVDRE